MRSMAHDPFDIDAQTKAEQDAKDKSALALRQEIEDLKWLMGGKRGRRFIARQLERSGVMASSFNTNTLIMSFNEGRRNEGLAMLAKIIVSCPEQYVLMLKENGEDV